jgi:hypothetical protein
MKPPPSCHWGAAFSPMGFAPRHRSLAYPCMHAVGGGQVLLIAKSSPDDISNSKSVARQTGCVTLLRVLAVLATARSRGGRKSYGAARDTEDTVPRGRLTRWFCVIDSPNLHAFFCMGVWGSVATSNLTIRGDEALSLEVKSQPRK